MSARDAVANAVARFYGAVDARAWEAVIAAMSAPVHVDYASFGGGPPADAEPAEVVAQWRRVLPGFDATHHQLGNMDVELEGARAQVRAYVTASHFLGGEEWTVRGRYELELVGAGDAWTIATLRFLAGPVTGSADLPERAARRASA